MDPAMDEKNSALRFPLWLQLKSQALDSRRPVQVYSAIHK